jgi:hypothetical protein
MVLPEILSGPEKKEKRDGLIDTYFQMTVMNSHRNL